MPLGKKEHKGHFRKSSRASLSTAAHRISQKTYVGHFYVRSYGVNSFKCDRVHWSFIFLLFLWAPSQNLPESATIVLQYLRHQPEANAGQGLNPSPASASRWNSCLRWLKTSPSKRWRSNRFQCSPRIGPGRWSWEIITGALLSRKC